MATTKKSFILYKDSLEVLNELSDDQAGQLFKAIYSHQIGSEYDIDAIVKMVFLHFKNQFKRDDDDYEEVCKRNKTNALSTKSQSLPVAASGSQSLPVEAHTDKDTDKEKEKGTEKKEILFVDFWDSYHVVSKKPKEDKAVAEKFWKRLTKEEKEKAVAGVELFCSGKETQFIKKAYKYLEYKNWTDEHKEPEPEISLYDKTRNHYLKEWNDFQKLPMSEYDLNNYGDFTKWKEYVSEMIKKILSIGKNEPEFFKKEPITAQGFMDLLNMAFKPKSKYKLNFLHTAKPDEDMWEQFLEKRLWQYSSSLKQAMINFMECNKFEDYD